MSHFESGVKSFIKTQATVTVMFPVDFKDHTAINCMQCKFFSRHSGICQLTKEISEYPTKYVGRNCPLTPVDESEGE